jgi:hypothetical protein
MAEFSWADDLHFSIPDPLRPSRPVQFQQDGLFLCGSLSETGTLPSVHPEANFRKLRLVFLDVLIQ